MGREINFSPPEHPVDYLNKNISLTSFVNEILFALPLLKVNYAIKLSDGQHF